MKYDAERFGLETVGGRVQAATACSRPEVGKLLVESRGGFARCPSGMLWCDAEHDDGAAADQENYAAAMRRIKSSCSDWDSAPMVKASRRLSERAKQRASSWRWRRSPWPRIFMPTMPFPAARISRSTARTVSGSASMYAPTGLMRTRSTSTQGDLAAARSASMLWHEQP